MSAIRQEAALIDLVYETALDADLWPTLLEALATLLETTEISAAGRLEYDGLGEASMQKSAIGGKAPVSLFPVLENGSEPSLSDAKEESQRFAQLVPHLRRALELNRRVTGYVEERNAALAVLDNIPVGFIIVEHDARIVASNRRANEMIGGQCHLVVENDVLRIAKADDAERLGRLIRMAAQACGEASATLTLAQEGKASPLSIFVMPYHGGIQGGRAAVLIAAGPDDNRITEAGLESLFGLTPAEARLAKGLAQGRSLERIAGQFGISKHTARVQLKSVFAKTATTRQAELVRLILTNPAAFINEAQTPAGQGPQLAQRGRCIKPKTMDQRRRLADGRWLGFAEYGDPHGKPVFLYHGMLGCRYQRHPDDGVVGLLGIRLIIPDRPGFGLSTPKPGRGFVEWSDDVLELADTLDIDRFALAGYSVGGFYAAATAYKAPERLTKVALVSCMPPFTAQSDLEGMLPSHKMLCALARHLPSVAARFMQLSLYSGLRDPQRFIQRLPKDSEDRLTLADAAVRENYFGCVAEAAGNGMLSAPWELVMLTRPWEFRCEDITIPVTLWHGEADRHAPTHLAHHLAARIPHCQAHFIPELGHFLIFRLWRQILEELIT